MSHVRNQQRGGPVRAGAARLVAAIAALVLAMVLVPAAQAAPVYEIVGEWQEPPATVATGSSVVAQWRVSVNDDAAAPENSVVENVTFTATAQSGTFAALPDACLTTGVTPVSALSADGLTLTCNVGAQQQGTAVLVATTVVASGSTGDLVGASATIGGQTATLTQIPVANPFSLDIRWQDSINGGSTINTNSRDVRLQWSLLHGRGAAAGPTTLTYTLNVSNTVAAGMAVGPGACQPFSSSGAAGHPWSGGSHPADQMTSFPTCTLTRTSGAGSGSATFLMTLTNIDYSQANVPTKDSLGAALPSSQAVIASGEVVIRVSTTETAGRVALTSSAPTYTAVSGESSSDLAANNSSSNSWTTGTIYGGWTYSFTGSTASSWANEYLVPQGATVRQASSYTFSNAANAGSMLYGALCVVLDYTHVQFTSAFAALDGQNGASVPGAQFLYYTSAIGDPNAFRCNTSTTGWTTTAPTNLNTVRAVMVRFPVNNTIRNSRPYLYVDSTLRPGVAIGQDVWTWAGQGTSTVNNSNVTTSGWTWNHAARSTTASDVGPAGTSTPGLRYPFSQGGRDVLRVVGTQPVVSKSASPASLKPGESTTYTISYSAEGNAAVTPTRNNYQIVDTLPAGMTYVAGSSSLGNPTITTSGGRQVLTWTVNGVPVNVAQSMTFQALTSTSLAPGTALVNEVSATVDGQSRTATATVRISQNGVTRVAKQSDQALVPNATGEGSGNASWTVTVSSFDPTPQAFTDTIDVLPYMGDGRGSDFAGDYTLSGPVTTSAAGTVYYTTAAPATINLDPAHASNGSAGSISGNSVGWSTTFTPDATAVRVIGGTLAPTSTFSFTVPYAVTGMESADTLVNVAWSRAENTRLLMKTSDAVSVATFYSASLKKYVLASVDADPSDPASWLDANDPATYPVYRVGDDVRYRIVLENTGQGDLTDVIVTDDLTGESWTIDSLPRGETVIAAEFTSVYSTQDPATIVNTACATAPTPGDSATEQVTINCDPAGILQLNHPDVVVEKGADPVSGTRVNPGDVVEYSITFRNTGDVEALVDYTDHLAGVLDDAVLDPASISLDSESLAFAWDETTQRIRVSGLVEGGETVTLRYTVTVSTGVLGDAVLGNVVTDTDEEPPGECEADDPLCTEHPVRGTYEIGKSADPVTGSTVSPGDTISYTVNVIGRGAPIQGITVTDDLTGVVSHADFVAGSGHAVIRDGFGEVVFDGPIADAVVGGDPLTGTLTAGPFDLPSMGNAVITYDVVVHEDAWNVTLLNAVTAQSPDPEDPNGPPVFPERCLPSFPGWPPYPGWPPFPGGGGGGGGASVLAEGGPVCTTTHETNPIMRVEKLGESVEGTWVRMGDSAWEVRADVAGEPGDVVTALPVAGIDGELGLFQVSDVPAGTYWLVETQAPEGFSLLAEPVRFSVDGDGAVALLAGDGDGVVTVAADEESVFTITVRDVPAMELPEAGGSGTTPYQLVGLVLGALAVAAVLRARSRRTGKEIEPTAS